MFGIGMPELIIILVIALIVIGPKKLPDLAKALGKGMSEFKKATQEIKESLNVEEDLREVKEDLVDSVSGLKNSFDQEDDQMTEVKPPKYSDFDEMIDEYEKEKQKQGEEAPALKEEDALKDPGVSTEKNRDD
ncbi:MAG: twin-arginine translocase TatA/TatE family subunit [Deltaproteobacteria bacterium]|nr:twin-arginine translocase TatA/TatE family subunit [Deltaproteobacteria bacterium]MBW2047748.1 twin-arginine translocase TatA/TatE family subunit [Deltaproteobacteria bacterium]MBW2110391.1 twin-arginine translocase TatA/TatE family subunit [Deltaproteobacteria bacterium]MBW2351881.1 twin-arginine translocase TatA/TatE family subunit [Deltaproteobacteria bacterium]HDZ91625.1 twin-arginine translocase TatA/TatE family subunit [Deltaproteobacteria bacterium]